MDFKNFSENKRFLLEIFAKKIQHEQKSY